MSCNSAKCRAFRHINQLNKVMNELVIEKKISLYKLNDIIITAIEGGSNYWYFISPHAEAIINCHRFQKIAEDGAVIEVPEKNCFSEAILPAVLSGKSIDIHDVEEVADTGDEEELWPAPIGKLSYESIYNGIKAMEKDNRPELKALYYGDDSDSEYDADTADVIFQYITLGEIVYG